MYSEIDPARADGKDQAGKQNRDQIGDSFVLDIPAAEEDDHTVEDQNREGMSAGKAVSALTDQMKLQVRPCPVKGNLQSFLNSDCNKRRCRHGDSEGRPSPGNQKKQTAQQGNGLPVAQVGDRGEKCGQPAAAETVDIFTHCRIEDKYVPGDYKI